MHGLKLSINLEMPKENTKQCIKDKMLDCMERVEYGTDRPAYIFLRKLNNYLVCKHKEGKCNPKMTEMLQELIPFMAKYGLQDPVGVDFVEPMVTNPDYKEDSNED